MTLFMIYKNGASNDFPLKYYFKFDEDTNLRHSNGKTYFIPAGKGTVLSFKNRESLFGDHYFSEMKDVTEQIH